MKPMKPRFFPALICSMLCVVFGAECSPAHADVPRVVPYHGTLSLERTDVEFEGSRPLFCFARSYRSDSPGSPDLGPGWLHSFSYRILEDPLRQCLMLQTPEHVVTVFDASGSRGVFRSGKGEQAVRTGGGGYRVEGLGQERLHFDAQGCLTAVENGYGTRITLAYDTSGRLSEARSLFGQHIRFSYDQGSRMTGLLSSAGDEIRFSYDRAGHLSGVSAGARELEAYGIARGCIARATLSGLGTWQVGYGIRGVVTSVTDPAGAVARHRVEASAEVCRHDILGPCGGTTRMEWNRAEGLSRITDPEGGVSTTRYDPDSGLPVRVTDPNGGVVELSWDDKGRLQGVRDPLGRVTRWEYEGGESGVVRMTRPDGSTLALTLDTLGNPLKIADSVSGTHVFTWDKLGRPISHVGPLGEKRSFHYGRAWLPERITEGKQELLGFVVPPGGRPTHFSLAGNEPVAVDEYRRDLGRLIAAVHPGFDGIRPGTEQRSRDGLSSYVLDAMGNPVSIQFEAGTRIEFAYDRAGRLVSEKRDGKLWQTRAYDPAGNLRSLADARKKTTAFTRDPSGRLVRVAFPDRDFIEYAYDASDRPVKVVRGGQEVRYEYDARGREVSTRSILTSPGREALEREFLLASAYDERGRRTGLSGLGHQVSYARDSRGLLTEVRSNLLGAIRFERDSGGGLLAVHYPNGVTTRIEPSPNGPKQYSVHSPGGLLCSVELERDSRGRVVSRTRDGQTERYTYDERSQLVAADLGGGSFRYEYDGAGSRIREETPRGAAGFSYSPARELKTRGKDSFSHDRQGNLTAKKTPAGQARYEFDHDNRLRTARSESDARVGYAYDGWGLPVVRTEGPAVTFLVRDRFNPFAEVTVNPEAGESTRSYLYGDGIGEILAMEHGGRRYYFHRDERNSVHLVTDEQGRVAASYEYDPFGCVLASTGGFSSPVRFAGQVYDETLGLYAMGHRFYDPQLGRFLSPDPVRGSIHHAPSTNPYLYALNDPVNLGDPTGLWAWPTWLPLVGGSEAAAPSVSGVVDPLVGGAGVNPLSGGNNLFQNVADTAVSVISNNADLSRTARNLPTQLVNKMIEVHRNNPEQLARVYRPDAAFAQKFHESAGHTYAVAKHAMTLADTSARVKSGMMTREEGLNTVVSETVGAVGETTAGYLVGLTGGAAVGAGTVVGTVLVVNYTSGKVKEAVREGMGAYDAGKLADTLEKAVPENLRFSAMTTMQNAYQNMERAEAALKGGRMQEANALISQCMTQIHGVEDFIDKNGVSGLEGLVGDLEGRYGRLTDSRRALLSARTGQLIQGAGQGGRVREQPAAGKPGSFSGGVAFLDEDLTSEAHLRQSLEQRKQQERQRLESEVAQGTQASEQSFREGMQSLGAGLQALQGGLTQVYQQSREYELQHEQVARENREQSGLAVEQTIQAQRQRQEEFRQEYGDIWGQQAAAAQGRAVTQDMLGTAHQGSIPGGTRSSRQQASGTASSGQGVINGPTAPAQGAGGTSTQKITLYYLEVQVDTHRTVDGRPLRTDDGRERYLVISGLATEEPSYSSEYCYGLLINGKPYYTTYKGSLHMLYGFHQGLSSDYVVKILKKEARKTLDP